MNRDPFSLWVYLSQSPLLWLTVTLLVYATADAVSLATHRHPLANLSWLFVPAGGGVVQKLDLIVNHGIAFLGVLAISVLITLLVTVGTFIVASRLMTRGESER